MASEMRSAQGKTGITIRTRQGTNIFPESSPQLIIPFGAALTAGGGTNFLAAPGAGFCWVVTFMTISSDAGTQGGVSVTFTGGLACTITGSTPQTLISSPVGTNANVAFGCSSSLFGGSGPVHFSVSGTAYKATVVTATNPSPSQLIATAIDSDTPTDLG